MVDSTASTPPMSRRPRFADRRGSPWRRIAGIAALVFTPLALAACADDGGGGCGRQCRLAAPRSAATPAASRSSSTSNRRHLGQRRRSRYRKVRRWCSTSATLA